MAEFTQLIKSGNTQKAYSHRQAILNEIKRNVSLIKELDQENPIARTFNRVETNVNESLNKLKLANIDLDTYLVKSNPDIYNDESYKIDQKSVNEQFFEACNTMDDYIKLLNSKGTTYPPDVKPECSGDLAAILTSQDKILNTLVTSQDKNAVAQNKLMTTLDKNLNAIVVSQGKNVTDLSTKLVNQIKSQVSSKSGPKALQPKFKPKNNDSDYSEFKDFLKKFEFFTVKCSSNLEKLQWLQTSVEGDAVGLIKHLTLSEDNYQTALNRLNNRYCNPDVVKHALFQSILKFKC